MCMCYLIKYVFINVIKNKNRGADIKNIVKVSDFQQFNSVLMWLFDNSYCNFQTFKLQFNSFFMLENQLNIWNYKDKW